MIPLLLDTVPKISLARNKTVGEDQDHRSIYTLEKDLQFITKRKIGWMIWKLSILILDSPARVRSFIFNDTWKSGILTIFRTNVTWSSRNYAHYSLFGNWIYSNISQIWVWRKSRTVYEFSLALNKVTVVPFQIWHYCFSMLIVFCIGKVILFLRAIVVL